MIKLGMVVIVLGLVALVGSDAAATHKHHHGKACGAAKDEACPADHYCEAAVEGQCPADGQAGVCAAKPELCPEICKTVCGCDGAGYCNECLAARAGTSVAHAGECAAAAQCKAATDCKGMLPHICKLCSDGKQRCAHFVCKVGQCQTEVCP